MSPKANKAVEKELTRCSRTDRPTVAPHRMFRGHRRNVEPPATLVVAPTRAPPLGGGLVRRGGLQSGVRGAPVGGKGRGMVQARMLLGGKLVGV